VNRKKPTIVKKTTKKIAKRARAAKKNSPIPKRISIEELAAILAENHAKTEASIRKLSAENAKSREETYAIIAKSREETDNALRELSAVKAETLTAVKEASDRSEKAIAEIRIVTDRMEDNFGGVSKRLGDLAEILVVPKIRIDINKLGNHNFKDAVADKKVVALVDGVKDAIAEVDMLLLGDDEAMAVEIKAHLKKTKVDTHLKRLQKLRDYENEAGIAGKKLFGAVVGVIVDDEARKHAKKNGLYVVEIREEEGKLDVEKPETYRTW